LQKKGANIMRNYFSISLSCLLIFLFTIPLTAQWIKQNSGTMNSLRAVYFTDANTGTVVGDSGIILRTTNGGATWMPQSSGTTKILSGVSFTDANTGTVVGDSGTIFRTTNGGATWTPQSGGTILCLRGVCFTDANNGTMVGGDWFSATGIILCTTNGGTEWVKQYKVDTACINAVSFIDGNVGTAVGVAKTAGDEKMFILHTTDAGTTWTSQNIPDPGRGWYFLLSVSFIDGMIGIAVGGQKIEGAGISIQKTTDGGITWTNPVRYYGTLYGIYLTDAKNGTAVGEWGNIIHTTDGGATWIDQSSGTTNRLYGVCFTDANTGTAIGDSGTILRTTNGGTLVENQQGIPQQYLLNQNYPNPFNPSTTIIYELPKSSETTLTIYDVLGREVSVLVNERKNAGVHEIRFDGSNLASGVYFYRLQAGTYNETKKLLLLK
jgi:photosystem II stability/assembly factor-like uncharacterized protein